MIKRPDQRVAVFIDTQNMYHSAKHLFGSHLNFRKLVEAVVEGRPLVRAIAYVATSKTGEERGFFDALAASGIEVKSKELIEFASGERKADWDVGIAVDAMKFSSRVDVVVLITGDGDFVPLVQFLQNTGVQVEVAAFSESTSKILREACDIYFDISQHADELLLGSKGGNRAKRAPEEASEDEIFDLGGDADDSQKGKGRKVKVTV